MKDFKTEHLELPDGPTVAFDVDDTLIMWNAPEDHEGEVEMLEIDCEGVKSYRAVNKHTVNLLKKFYESGHIVVVWSASGVRWVRAVCKALCIDDYVHLKMSKLSYFVDDKADPSRWMGKHGYIDINGNVQGHHANSK